MRLRLKKDGAIQDQSKIIFYLSYFAVIILICAFFLRYQFHKALPTGFANTPQADNYTQQYSKLHFYQEQISKWKIPLWDPYVGCGSSDYPIRSHPLYPFSLLSSLLFNTRTAIVFDEALAFLLFYIFFLLFLKSLGISHLSSQVASISILFSGPLIWTLFYPSFIQSMVWIPLLFYCQENILQKKSNYFFIALGATALGLQIMAGMLQLTLYTLGFLFIYAFFRLFIMDSGMQRPKFCLRIIKAHIAILGFGISIGAIRLIPLFYSSHQLRPGHGDWEFFSKCFFKISHIYQSIAPFNFSRMGPTMYLGIITLIICALFVLTGKKEKTDWFWITMVVIIFLFAIKSPLTYLAFKFIPKYKDFNALRIILLGIFPLTVILAKGLDDLTLYSGGKKRRQSALLFLLAFSFAWILSFPLVVSLMQWKISNVQLFLLLISFICCCLLGLFFYLYYKNILHQRFLVLGIGLLIAADLFSHGILMTTPINTEPLFQKTSIINILKNKAKLYRIARLGDRWSWVTEGRLYNMEALRADNLYEIHAYSSMINPDYRNLIDKIRKSFDFHLPPFDTSASIQPFLLEEELESPIVNLLGVKYILSLKPLINKINFRFLTQEGCIRLYENVAHYPRAFMAYRAKYFFDRTDLINTMIKKNKLLDTVYIETDSTDLPNDFIKPPGKYSLDFQKYIPNEVIIQVTTSEDGYLFLSDIYDPRWKVKINGNAGKILRTNATFRSVFLKAGSHIVHFVYFPAPFFLGAGISLFMFSLLWGMAISLIVKKKSNRLGSLT